MACSPWSNVSAGMSPGRGRRTRPRGGCPLPACGERARVRDSQERRPRSVKRAALHEGTNSASKRAPRITLTFDNGPDPEVTPQVLDVLARADVKASFFVLGHKLQHPARRAAAERA